MKAVMGVTAAVLALSFSLARSEEPVAARDALMAAKEYMSTSGVSTLKATVVSVDLTNRTLTVRGPRGRLVAMKVSDKMTDLPGVREGDAMVLQYRPPKVLDLRRAAGPADASSMRAVFANPEEGKPGGKERNVVTIQAKVVELDGASRTITVDAGDARELTLSVPASIKTFDALKVGDYVASRYEEAFVVSVKAP